MDEPQLTNRAEETVESTDKSDLNEALSSTLANEELEKSLNVDDVSMGDEPSTSTDAAITEEVPDTVDPIEEPTAESQQEHAGQVQDILMTDDQPEESVEQVIFEKPIGELDETVQSEIETDNLEFAEHSINISQLNVEHNDDSNDAFNALKESETDALQTPKEEVDEPKVDEPEASSDLPEDDAIVAEPVESIDTVQDDVQPIEPMETESSEISKEKADGASTVADTSADESREVGTETADMDDTESIGAAESESTEKPDNEEVEETPDGKKMVFELKQKKFNYCFFSQMTSQPKQQMKAKGLTRMCAC